MAVLDLHDRPLRSLRISVTDRCNLRCEYCMPCEDYVWLRREELLSFEEIAQLASIFAGLGVEKVRLTGGEPLLRRDLDRLICLLAAEPGLRDLALTTNGLVLADCVSTLRRAGLRRLTVSLDTLRPERFRALTRRDGLEKVLEGIAAARHAGLESVKLNAVIMRGANDDELPGLLEFARAQGAELRFIEYMDVGGALRWSPAQVLPRNEMLARLESIYGPVSPVAHDAAAPAERYRLRDGTVFGIIASVTQPFCGSCDRARLTADGVWFLCLYARQGLDLKRLLRSGASPDEIAGRIREVWSSRRDRGAEERLSLTQRSTSLFRLEELQSDPHREMHTRGG